MRHRTHRASCAPRATARAKGREVLRAVTRAVALTMPLVALSLAPPAAAAQRPDGIPAPLRLLTPPPADLGTCVRIVIDSTLHPRGSAGIAWELHHDDPPGQRTLRVVRGPRGRLREFTDRMYVARPGGVLVSEVIDAGVIGSDGLTGYRLLSHDTVSAARRGPSRGRARLLDQQRRDGTPLTLEELEQVRATVRALRARCGAPAPP